MRARCPVSVYGLLCLFVLAEIYSRMAEEEQWLDLFFILFIFFALFYSFCLLYVTAVFSLLFFGLKEFLLLIDVMTASLGEGRSLNRSLFSFVLCLLELINSFICLLLFMFILSIPVQCTFKHTFFVFFTFLFLFPVSLTRRDGLPLMFRVSRNVVNF